MKDLIKKILREDDDFQWMSDIEPDLNIEMGQLWLRHDGVNKLTEKFFVKEAEKTFNDIHVEGDKVYLEVDGYEDFADLFNERDNSQYGYVNKWLFENIHKVDDYWEPYTDVVYDWEEQVWSLIESDKDMFSVVVKNIRELMEHSEIVVELDSSSPWGAEPVLLDEEVFNYLTNKNTAQLGFIIDSDHVDEFETIKLESTWAYTDAYNTAARDNIYEASLEPIIDMFGKGTWKEEKAGEKTKYRFIFDITSDFTYNIDQYFSRCFDDCSRYFNPSDHDQELSKEELFEDFCDDCWEIGYSDYLSFLEYGLFETGYYDKFNPSFSEYPDDTKVSEYFKESFFNFF